MADDSNTITTKQLVQWLAGILVMLASAGGTLWVNSVSGQIQKLQDAFTAQHAKDSENVAKLSESLNTGLTELRKQYYEQALARQDNLGELKVQVNDLKRQMELVNDRLADLRGKREEK